MYENSSDSSVATVCRGTRESSSHRLAQFPASSRPMVAGGALHGPRLADSPQSPASQGQRPSRSKADVEGVRPSGRRHSSQQEIPCRPERLAQMGEKPEDSRQPLHSQGEAAMVEGLAPQGPVSVENVLRLLEYQQYRCALTGRRLTPKTAALDHMAPVRFGGKHIIENAQVLHKEVNRAKGALTSDEFTGLCREVVQWSDRLTARKDS